MIRINVIASSSKGNAITVSDGSSTLLLDAGLSYKKLSRSVKLSEVEAVLITHEHADHSKGVPELIRRGVDVMMSYGTAQAVMPECDWPYMNIVSHLKQTETEGWIILPFNVKHDAAEPLGFLIQSKTTGEKLVYIVDSAYVAYDFTGVTHWLVEANYHEAGLEASELHPAVIRRIRSSHMSLENLQKFFAGCDLSTAKEIHLLHLSDNHSDEELFVQEIQRQTGVPTYV